MSEFSTRTKPVQRLTTRSIKTASAIQYREPFTTSGALKGVRVEGFSLGTWDSGRLSGADLDEWRIAPNLIDYVVYSYDTPICWHSTTRGWHKVAQKFSRTTTKHQGNLYLVPNQVPPEWDAESRPNLALHDCKHYDTPGPDCSGPRVGITRDGVILCEGCYNREPVL